MTDQHPGHCYLRGNTGPTIAALDPTLTVLPEVFRAASYATGAFGKWGRGITCDPAPADPRAHGFDEFLYGWKSRTTDHISAFWVVLPTIAELIGQPVSEQNDVAKRFPEVVSKMERAIKDAHRSLPN